VGTGKAGLLSAFRSFSVLSVDFSAVVLSSKVLHSPAFSLVYGAVCSSTPEPSQPGPEAPFHPWVATAQLLGVVKPAVSARTGICHS
jgi:hypothetical protein